MNAFKSIPEDIAMADVEDANAAPLWAEWIAPAPLSDTEPAEDCRDAVADESSLDECCF